MSQSEIQKEYTKEELEKQMESKRKKMYPYPEDEENKSSPSRNKKTSSKNSKTCDNDHKENISVNKILEEGEIVESKDKEEENEKVENSHTQEKLNKSNLKSASKSRSRMRSRSKSNVKSAKSKSKSKSRPRKAEEDSHSATAYTLRPRKNIDYTKGSPDEKPREETGNQQEESDASFKVDENLEETELNKLDEMPAKENEAHSNNMEVEKEDICKETSNPQISETKSPREEGEVDVKEVSENLPLELLDIPNNLQGALIDGSFRQDPLREAPENSSTSSEQSKEIDEAALKQELKELQDENIEQEKGNYENFKKEDEEKNMKAAEN